MAGADNDGADLMIGGASQETDPPFCDDWLWILNMCETFSKFLLVSSD